MEPASTYDQCPDLKPKRQQHRNQPYLEAELAKFQLKIENRFKVSGITGYKMPKAQPVDNKSSSRP